METYRTFCATNTSELEKQIEKFRHSNSFIEIYRSQPTLAVLSSDCYIISVTSRFQTIDTNERNMPIEALRDYGMSTRLYNFLRINEIKTVNDFINIQKVFKSLLKGQKKNNIISFSAGKTIRTRGIGKETAKEAMEIYDKLIK